MTRIFFFSFCLFMYSFVHAQEKKNTSDFGFSSEYFLIEGMLSFRSVSGNTSENNFTFTPTLGYFITDNMALGGRISYQSSKKSDTTSVLDRRSAFRVEAFARHYFLEIGGRFKPYADYSIGFESGKQGVTPNEPTKYTAFGLAARLGINVFISETIALNVLLADVFSITSVNPQVGNTTTDFRANVNVFENFFTQTSFGLTFKL